jgi:hypothetical protein
VYTKNVSLTPVVVDQQETGSKEVLAYFFGKKSSTSALSMVSTT